VRQIVVLNHRQALAVIPAAFCDRDRGRVAATVEDPGRRRLEELLVAHLLPGHRRPVRVADTVWPEQRR
jgi:hypothetical protein